MASLPSKKPQKLREGKAALATAVAVSGPSAAAAPRISGSEPQPANGPSIGWGWGHRPTPNHPDSARSARRPHRESSSAPSAGTNQPPD